MLESVGELGDDHQSMKRLRKKVRTLFEAEESANDIAKEYGIGRATVYKIINEENFMLKTFNGSCFLICWAHHT